MKLRVILVCTLLILAASPSFALPQCEECNQWNMCEVLPGSYERCHDGPDYCDTNPFERCSHSYTQSTVLADWKVASIETSCPAQSPVAVTAAADDVNVATSIPQTTELK